MMAYRVRTSHGSDVCYDPTIKSFAHGQGGAAFLLPIGPTNGFFLAFDASAGSVQVVPVRIRSLADGPHCSLIEPVGGRSFRAEPASAPHEPGRLAGLSDSVGAWELFTLHMAELPPEIATSDLLRDLRELAGAAPTIAGLVAALALDPPCHDIAVLRAFVAVLPSSPEAMAALLMAHPHAAARLAALDDPWMQQGLPDLARWLADRDGGAHRRRLGGHLDCLVDDGRTKPPGQAYAGMVRSAVLPRRRACIVATARNEGIYLLEWIAYHRAIGFEHFFIYSNDNDDSSDELLGALADAGVITWIDNQVATPVSPQRKAYGHAFGLLPEVLDYEWALVIDLDEFFVFDTARFASVHDYIAWQSLQPVDAVALNWLMFGTFGTRRWCTQRGLTERFTARFAEVDQHIKCLFRPRLFSASHPHYPVPVAGRAPIFRDSNGAPYAHTAELAHAVNRLDDAAWINHYWSKSMDELTCKFARNRGGLASVPFRPSREIVEDIAYRVLSSERGAPTAIDRRIRLCAPNLPAAIDALMRLPGVRQAAALAVEGFARNVGDVRLAMADLDGAELPLHVREALGLVRDDPTASSDPRRGRFLAQAAAATR